MAYSDDTVTEEVVVQRVRKRYRWPAMQLNFWLLIMFVAASLELGVFATFSQQQSQLQVGTPWYFAYWITVAALTLIFLILMLVLINNRQLLPGIVILGSFICFVLWMVGLIVIGIQLWGNGKGVSSQCKTYVNDMQYKGQSAETLAWLEQNSICQSWEAAWAFQLVGVIFFFWLMIMAVQVYQDDAA